MNKAELQKYVTKQTYDLQAYRMRVYGSHDRDNESTTFHECAHQLIHQLRIAPMEGDVPRWLAEGLATIFEAARAGDLRETTTVNYHRLVDYRAAHRTLTLVALVDLLTDDGHLFGDAAIVGYAQSWALVHYLLQEHPERMRRYIERIAAHAASAGGKQRRIADFKAVFGDDLDAFEESWIAYVRAIH